MGKNSITKMSRKFNSRKKLFFVLCSLFFVFYWLFLIRPAWTGKLDGTFKIKQEPKEYIELKDFVYKQPKFFRTFWIPKRQRFGFYDNSHPAIDAFDLLKVSSISGVVNWLEEDKAKEKLLNLSIRYIIIPYDSEKELFLEDRKYNKKKREKLEEDLKMIKWLRRLDKWKKIAIFEVLY